MHCYKADLHIHSVLSPCGGLEMSPKAVIQRIRELNIEWMAITDHNSLANCPAYAEAAESEGIAFTFGVEVQTAEEIHLLVYFDDREKAMEFDSQLYEALLPIKNDADFFGDQVVIDAQENIIRIEDRALSNSVIWNLEETKEKAEFYGGFCIPAHVDADANSVISQLGFLPPYPVFPVLGITAGLNLAGYLEQYPELADHAFLRSSDAHYLSDLGSGTAIICVAKPSVGELVLAVRKSDKREIII
jgi:PHP family Zn ribbon phosphoesterase